MSRFAAANANVVIGYRAGDSLVYGDLNMLIGDNAGRFLESGGGNLFIGKNAGRFLAHSNFRIRIGDFPDMHAYSDANISVEFFNADNLQCSGFSLEQLQGIVGMKQRIQTHVEFIAPKFPSAIYDVRRYVNAFLANAEATLEKRLKKLADGARNVEDDEDTDSSDESL